jgi:uncharacterized protein
MIPFSFLSQYYRSFGTGLLIIGMGWLSPVTGADPKEKEKEKHPANRLAKESSPYLLQHAHNPVNWYPWGEEAFEKAKKEKKLIFLSVGYSSCHWCHVMEKESFANKEVAEILNKNFVCIKVDREERPDIDDIYMNALYVMGARGGWPMSMFMMPDGKPIVGGTYWPREDREIDGQKMRGFKSILQYMNEAAGKQWKELQEQADEIAKSTAEQLNLASRLVPLIDLDEKLIKDSLEAIQENIDPVHGGIGSKSRRHVGTKFPMPPTMRFLLLQSQEKKDKELAAQVKLTLEKMAMGGIYDHLGGGFHRYSTERTWTVPHFEKMLYDNAQLVELYALAYSIDPQPMYKKVIEETLEYIRREMTSPEGGFYSALDADSEGKEGEFYVWNPEEIEKVIDNKKDAALFRAVYGVSGNPNFEEKSFILKLSRTMSEIAKEQKISEEELNAKIQATKTKLLEYRGKRPRPFLDTKILTSWNGQMIAGYALAGKILKQKEYLATAEKAADFILKNLKTKKGRLLRTYGKNAEGKSEAKLNAYLDDYANFIHGLLVLFDATKEKRWLEEAKSLAETMIQLHGDGEKGGYFYTSKDHEKLFARVKDYTDNVLPGGNGASVRNFLTLAKETGDGKYRQLAEKSFKQFAAGFKMSPTSVPTFAETLQVYLSTNKEKSPKEGKNLPKSGGNLSSTESVVKMEITPKKSEDSEKRIFEIELTIEKPWHLYANPVGNEGLVASQTSITLKADGKELPAMIKYPSGMKFKDQTGEEYLVYEDSITIRIETQVKEGTEIEFSAKLQACSDKNCLKPSTLKKTLK